MKRATLILGILAVATSAMSQNKKQDVDAIKSMCGCYSITFDYAETFPVNENYELHDPYHAEAKAEWIFVEEETEDKIVIQHLLVINDSTIVKHWRQDWLFENEKLYEFHADRNWHYTKLKKNKVANQWTQKVYQVDDSPRYEGSATWRHVDGKHYWENTTDAPLPRREFSKRSDYNVMQRTNQHILTDYGWLHEQDNMKIVRTEEGDKTIVAEKGLNKYTKIANKNCKPAMKWWKENAKYWELVRAEWSVVYDRNEDLFLAKKVEDQLLWQALFALNKKSVSDAHSNPEKVREEIREVLQKFITDGLQARNNN